MQLGVALYGHADAGRFWEERCEEKLTSVKYTKLAEERPGLLWLEATKSLLIVYVDDVKPSAKAELHDALWAEITKEIDMDPETLDGRFLGCSHERYDTVASKMEGVLDNHPIYHPRPSLGTNPLAKARGEEVGHTQRQALTPCLRKWVCPQRRSRVVD